jgi:exopolysaccharide biosynthesis polyprenyl glycosylphosphotransferase
MTPPVGGDVGAETLTAGARSAARTRRLTVPPAWMHPPGAASATLLHVLRREGLHRRGLALADVVATALALVIVVASGSNRIEILTLLALPLVVVVIKVIGLYDRDELLISKSTLAEAPAMFQVATLYAFVFWVLHGNLIAGDLSKRQVITLWVLLFLFFLVGRTVARRLMQAVAAPERCLLIGDEATYTRLAAQLNRSRATKAQLIGRVDFPKQRGAGGDSNGDSWDIKTLISELGLHRLIVVPSSIESDDVLEFIEAANAVGVRVSVLPRVFEVVGSSVEVDRLDGAILLGVRRFGLTRSSRTIKRAVDVVVSAVGLVVLAPLLALVALVTKVESPGAVFFRQTRVGRGGQPFLMFKFRSMVEGADARKVGLRGLNEADGLFKIADDPRVTRFGRWLRTTSLDELPQLWNVLRGEMSLVGPRPLVPEEDERIEGWHRRRLQLAPGMTGHWQVLGSARVPLHEMVAIDYLYLANWSLWLDIQLLLRTVPHVLRREGM